MAPGHDRYFRGSCLESDFSLVKVPAHASRDVEAERAAARQEDRVHLLHEIHGIQQIGFNRSGSRPANIDTADGTGFGKDDSAASQPLRACNLTDLDSRHGGDAGRRWGTDTSLLLAGAHAGGNSQKHGRGSRRARSSHAHIVSAFAPLGPLAAEARFGGCVKLALPT